MNTATNASKWTEFDYIICLDASGSMGEPSKRGTSSPSRWEVAQETVTAIARTVAKFDDDGIDVVRFGGNVQQHQGVTVDKVRDIFATEPAGGTPTLGAIQAALKLAGKSSKKDFIIVLTDGEPNQGEAPLIKQLLIDTANKQETDDSLTFLFIQVGDNAQATSWLKSLDDDLVKAGAKFDIVDVKTAAEVDGFASIPELLEAALND